MPTREQIEHGHYMNFLLNALCGRTADHYFDQYKSEISQAWKRVRFSLGVNTTDVIHRGIMLDPAQVERNGGVCKPCDHIRYISFTEDLEVAKVFADPLHPFGGPMREQNPHYQGYLIQREPRDWDVLFHWRWAVHLNVEKYLGSRILGFVLQQKEVMITGGWTFPVKPIPPGSADPKLGAEWT